MEMVSNPAKRRRVHWRRAGAMAVVVLSGAGCKSDPSATTQAVVGESAYMRRCATCHQSHGKGSGASWPSLVGSPWLVRDHETPIRIALLGVQGEMVVHGTKFYGMMPSQGVVMSDREIAEVLTYARGAWGNQADPITEAEVTAVRSGLAGRTTPWTARELEALRAP